MNLQQKQMSWLDCVSGEPIRIGENRPVYLLVPREYGKNLVEYNYKGYGVFSGRNVFELVTEWNMPQKFSFENMYRNILLGIDLACGNDRNFALKYPIKVTYDDLAQYEECLPSIRDPFDGTKEMPKSVQSVYQTVITELEQTGTKVKFEIYLLDEDGDMANDYESAVSAQLAIMDAAGNIIITKDFEIEREYDDYDENYGLG